MKRILYIILVIVAAFLGLFIGSFIWEPVWPIPSPFKYDILRDTLVIVLSVIAIGITVVSIVVYRVISNQLQIESAATARLETVKSSVRLSIVLGFEFWESYDKAEEGEKEVRDLTMAIRLTERALIYHNQLPAAVAHNRENEKEFCLIKNNLAYYFALEQKAENREIAREYAQYIRNRVSQYAGEKTNWLETYEFVKQQYPD